jgi:hypothetical protein
VSNSSNRSFEKIEIADLERLRDLALGYLDDLFTRKPDGSGRLRGHLMLLCLVQGGARHFVYRDRGVRDFDVLGLFRSIPDIKYNPQHMKSLDFGPSKFGSDPDEPWLQGRKVDIVGRSIEFRCADTSVLALRRYLEQGKTQSARLWAQRPVVGLWPKEHLGRVLWDSEHR